MNSPPSSNEDANRCTPFVTLKNFRFCLSKGEDRCSDQTPHPKADCVLASHFVRYRTSGALQLVGCHLSPRLARSRLRFLVAEVRVALRVLVVDDSETTRGILRTLLGSRNWTICGEAENGWSGVEKFEELKPDVVVLDLAMPVMDGIEAAKLMSMSDAKIPIILFTILGFEGMESVAKDAGIRAIVSKTEAWRLIPQIEKLAHLPNTAV
jgi:two-component system, chemotaxis family, chemotaxis protein CheY